MASKSLLVVLILFCGQSFVHSLGLTKTIPINLNCGQVSNYKWLNLVRPSSGQICNYVIKPYHLYVCQLRVDFTTNLPSPLATPGEVPACPNTGYIQIGRFRICGTSANQHLYIPFDGSNLQNSYTISANPGGGNYQMLVTQIVCPPGKSRSIEQLNEQSQPEEALNAKDLIGTRTYDTDLMAPSGCDQYFTSSSGSVESFNWNNGQGPYPGNTRYTVCFKKSATQSKLQLFAQYFDLEYNDAVMQTGSYCNDAGGMPGMANDYIYAPMSKILETGVTSEYYCGTVVKEKTLESNLFGLFWFIFNSGQTTGVGATKRIFKFYYNIY